MSTMKDIALVAGVSIGTVSNVLNDRGNVSVEKMEAVLGAAEQLGYRLNVQAQLLRSKSNTSVAIVLPNLTSEKYNQFFNAFRQSMEAYPFITYDMFFTDDQEQKELRVLNRIATGGYRKIIAISCLKNASAYTEILKISINDVFFVYRSPQNSSIYFNLDYRQAITVIFNELIKTVPKSIGVYAESHYLSCGLEFTQAVQEELTRRKMRTNLIVVDSTDKKSYESAFDFYSSKSIPDVVITQDIERASDIIKAGYFGGGGTLPTIYSLTGNKLPSISNAFFYSVNYTQLGQIVSDSVSLSIKNSTHQDGAIVKGIINSVRGNDKETRQTPINQELTLLTIPSPATNAIKKILPDFTRQTGISVNLAIRSAEEIFAILSNIESHSYYELLRIDVASLPWFAKRALKPLHTLGDSVTSLINAYLDYQQERFCKVGNDVYALPFDASVQLFFYRKDLFEDPVLKRMFFETIGKELAPPKTFEDYNKILTFFHGLKKSGNSNIPYAAASTFGNPSIVASEFLLRYYAAGGRLLNNNETPKLDPEIAHDVLYEYLNLLPYTYMIENDWWGLSINKFKEGELAMIISYMNLLNDVGNIDMASSIGFAPVPGGTPQVGGGIIAVSKMCKKDIAATKFYQWLYSSEIVEQINMLGGNTINNNIRENQEIRYRYPWMELACQEMAKGIRESVSQNGTPFDLHQIETVIGRGVVGAKDNIFSLSEAIKHINDSLKAL